MMTCKEAVTGTDKEKWKASIGNVIILARKQDLEYIGCNRSSWK